MPPAIPQSPTRARGQEPSIDDSEAEWQSIADDDLLTGAQIYTPPGGVEVGTVVPKVPVDQALEAQLDHPTVVDKAVAALSQSAEVSASEMLRELDARAEADPTSAAGLAYELGELYERRLGDETRALKAYGRALHLDPSLRANLWALRRIFYRRAQWPNLVKLVEAELAYARDAAERADLLLEKARVAAYHMNEPTEARTALEAATQLAPTHQGVLLELERLVAKATEGAPLLDVWERLAAATEYPARKLAYELEVARAANSAGDFGRSQSAYAKALELADAVPGAAIRVARENLFAVERAGSPDDILAAMESLAGALQAAGDPGPSSEVRYELVALRRRQAQLVRRDSPEKAWELLQHARTVAPDEPLLRLDLTELAEELGRYDVLADLEHTTEVADADPARVVARSLRRIDALLRAGKRDEARALIESMHAVAPGFVALTSAAERDALASIDIPALAKIYLAAAEAALVGTWVGPEQTPSPDPPAAVALFVQAAELLAYEIATPDAIEEAQSALMRALEALPHHPAALEAAVELEDGLGDSERALARLRQLVASAPTPDAKRVALERGIRVARCHGDLEAVVEFERDLSKVAPGRVASLWHLEATLAQLGYDDERADVLLEIAAAEPEASHRGTALLAAARLRERAGAVEVATDLYRQVLAIWPDDSFARESLIDLLRAQERWAELVSERWDEAKALRDGPAARRALREAAWVLEVRLGDFSEAAQVYREWHGRFPDDRFALEGGMRCRAAIGDREGEADLCRALAQADPNAVTRWLYARALERIAKVDEAVDAYRGLLAGGERSVASAAAALALGELAAIRGDTAMRRDALIAVADRVVAPEVRAALIEGSGWISALALGDFDDAAESFRTAVALNPRRTGAQIGAAWAALRRGDTAALAIAYQGAAEAADTPEVAAALWLRSACLSAAARQPDAANQKIANALRAAPDDAGAVVVAAETKPELRVEASDPFAAIDPLLTRADALNRRAGLTDDLAQYRSWELDRAEVLERAGRLREAGAVVVAALRSNPNDVRALAALRRLAVRSGDASTVAKSDFALARVLTDQATQLELLREAVTVFDSMGPYRNPDEAVAVYARIVAIDGGAPEFERWFELLRVRGEEKVLVRAITSRLAWLAASNAIDQSDRAAVPLLLERAALMCNLDNRPAAIADLDAVLEHAPDQAEALRFRATLAADDGDFQMAIQLWQRYLPFERSAARRAEIELRLAQLIAEVNGDLAGAIEQLERVVDVNRDDPRPYEQLAELCTRASDWPRVVRTLRRLIRVEPSIPEKARHELRLGKVQRDHLRDHLAARQSFLRARDLDSSSMEILRELADLLEPAQRTTMLAEAAAALRHAIRQTPGDGELYQQLSEINALQDDADTRWLSLVGVEALGTLTEETRGVVARGRAHLSAPQPVVLDDNTRAKLRGTLGGPLAEIWRLCAPAVAVVTGVDAWKLGFAKTDKVPLRKLPDSYPAVSGALASFGLSDIEVFVSASRTGVARALAGDPPVLCLGADIAGAATAAERFHLGRVVATLAEGLGSLDEFDSSELASMFLSALEAVDVEAPLALAELAPGREVEITDRAKVFKKHLSRRARGLIEKIGQQDLRQAAAAPAEPSNLDIDAMRRAAFGVGCRAGLAWCGDLAVALEILDVGRRGRYLSDWPAVLELVAWSVSEDHAQLRQSLAMALPGRPHE